MTRIKRGTLPLHLRAISLLLCCILVSPSVALSRALNAGRGVASHEVALPTPDSNGTKPAGEEAKFGRGRTLGSTILEDAAKSGDALSRSAQPDEPRSASSRRTGDGHGSSQIKSPLFVHKMSRGIASPARVANPDMMPSVDVRREELKALPDEGVKAVAVETDSVGAGGGVEPIRESEIAEGGFKRVDKAPAQPYTLDSELRDLGSAAGAAIHGPAEGARVPDSDPLTLKASATTDSSPAVAPAVSPLEGTGLIGPRDPAANVGLISAGEMAAVADEGVESVKGNLVEGVIANKAAEQTVAALNTTVAVAVSPLVLQQTPPATAITNQSFDAAKDFARANNPGGAWSYGWKPSSAAAFALLPNNDNVYNLDPGLNTWYAPNGGANMPVMTQNATGATKTLLGTIVQPTDVLTLAPGPNGERTVVRWTAPGAMTVQVEGRFEGLDTGGATSDVSIIHNSATKLMSAAVNGYGSRVPFSFVRKVVTGDVIDFSVGYGANVDNAHDATGLAVKISPAAVAVYNPAKDFSRANNPGGVWSYGWKPSSAAAFALLPNNDNVYNLDPGLNTWYAPNGGANMPVMAQNATGATKTLLGTIVQPTDVLTLAPGPNGERTVVRWTAPGAMTVQVEGRFEGLDTGGATSDVSIIHNSTTTLASGAVNGYGGRVPFSLVKRVAAGDVIDFSVGYGANLTNYHDATGLGLTITQTFNAVDDFSATSKISGAWSYGWKPSSAAAFALLPNNDNVYNLDPGLNTWYAPNGGANMPVMTQNATGATKTLLGTIVQPTDVLTLAPGPNGERTVVRWTAPGAMTVQVEGRFEGLDTGGATSDVSIIHNSATKLMSAAVNGYGSRAPFSFVKRVAAGDVIDFSVGYGANLNNAHDATGLAVSITIPPLGAYWQFDEDGGAVAVDATGHENTGTLQTPSRSVGRDGSGALNFNGTGDLVTVAANDTLTNITNSFTISFWAYPRSTHQIDPEDTTTVSGTAGQRYVVGPKAHDNGHAGAGISVGTNGVSVYESASGYMPATLVYQGAITGWNHVAVVYENRQPKLYLNGTLVKSGQVSAKTFVNIVPDGLGSHAYGSFDGQLDDVRVYSRAMTPTEIQAIAAVGVVNAAPTVSITSPAAAATFTAPVNVNITANVADDGAVSKVQFFAGGNLVATKTEQPFTATWGNVAAGTYVLTAKATDDAGITTTSAPVNITVAAQPGTRPMPPAGGRLISADVVAFDQVLVYNRLGAINPGGMIYALRRDVVPIDPSKGLMPGNVQLRPDKRPRPLVLRMNVNDRLQVNFQNLLSVTPADGSQPATRSAGVHVVGMQLAGSILDDGSYVGQNASSLVAPGGSATYTFFAEREGNHLLYSSAATTSGEGDGGTLAMGLFGSVNVEPKGAEWYRSQLTAEELKLATVGKAADNLHPIINYDAVYPAGHRYAGLPILKMLQGNKIVHSDLNAIITGPNRANFPAGTYRPNAVEPNREQPFREFTVVYHDEVEAVQAFPEFYDDPVLGHTLHSVRDKFAINYGIGGIGSEILANRLGVGPMANCTECKYEEFFLSAWTVGDPAQLVDIPANASNPAEKVVATKVFYPDDPSNVHHSYIGDHVKMRVAHAGPKEHHIHHLHAHQWLRTPDDDNSSYLDSQALGPGYSFTTEIAHGGTGNRNRTPGDSIFHCHFYPHFAQGMWELWRAHDVFEAGTDMGSDGRPAAGSRALPDGEISAGTPIPAIVPIPTIAMAPMPEAQVQIVNGQVKVTGTGNPGFPFFVDAVAGHRPPHPPLDTVDDGGLPRHIITGGTFNEVHDRLDFSKELVTAIAVERKETGTPVELAAMAFHAKPSYQSYTPEGTAANFLLNGLPAKPGAPFADPCRDDAGNAAGTPRTYKAALIQLDLKINKVGWHVPQARILTLWNDVASTLAGQRPPEPFFFRANTNDCITFYHTVLAPNVYELDDFQVRTPTDVMGQHIHLVKFDVTSSDGAGNGWNYEDGTFAPDEVIERINAIRNQNGCATNDARNGTFVCPVAKPHPTLHVLGAQTTVQRWYADNTLNNNGKDRTLRTVFTHDHFGPSTHQQAGLYAGLVVEPKNSKWADQDTGVAFGGAGVTPREDGGPTSWRANIIPEDSSNSYREFLLEFADYQLAYEAGGGIGTGGKPVPDPDRAINPPVKDEVGLPFIVQKPLDCPGGVPLPCPEAVSAADPGTMSVNYRNEPLALRVRNPNNNTQAAGIIGDLSHAYRSLTNRADTLLNVQPTFYPALTPDVEGGDPFTPLLRAYENDPVQIRILVGAHEEGHNFQVNGIKWKFEPGTPDDPVADANNNTGYRNNQMMGISEHYEFVVPRLPRKYDGKTADFLYSPGRSVDDQWNGLWGLMRVFVQRKANLAELPNNLKKNTLAFNNQGEYSGVCPKNAFTQPFDISAVLAKDVLSAGTLIYNNRASNGGALHDPTAIMFVRTNDLDAAGKLKAGVPIEPLVLRAKSGDCISLTLRNKLPVGQTPPDLDGFNTMPMIVNNFNANQVKPSAEVGLHPQNLFYDVTRSDGMNVGLNPVQTVAPGASTTYQWYVGDVTADAADNGVATPIEFGATNLSSSDPIKHSNKGAFGSLIVEPAASSWVEDPNTRAQATVTTAAGTFREFVLMTQNDINLRQGPGNGLAVPNLAEEEDAEDSGQKAFNYRTEPLWKRMGYDPNAPLTGDPEPGEPVDSRTPTRALNFTSVLSNSKVGGADPETPVFTAKAGQAVRFRLLMAGGHSRNNVFMLHGHIWEEEPYTNNSTVIGSNPFSEWKGAQYGIGPGSHFDLLPKNGAGGYFQVPGDYLYRTFQSFQFDGGMWGIFRVTP